jgi:uncharacterized phosphosugar-binding protein
MRVELMNRDKSMNIIDQVFETCIAQLQQVQQAEAEGIHAAGEWVARAIAENTGFYLFGSGHSAYIARDAFWRAGGLAPALPIFDPLGGDAERLEGYAAFLLARYDLQPGGVMLIISNSGINALPLEIALAAKDRGLKVIALTSRSHSSQVPSRHSSGQKLMEIADLVIDTHGIPGDAAVELPNSALRVAPTSTVIGAAIVQAICAAAAARLLEMGIQPPVIVSMNMPDGDDWNRALERRYRPSLVRFEVAAAPKTPKK